MDNFSPSSIMYFLSPVPTIFKQDMIKKIANQCATFDGKGKLTVDDLYSVIKVQVKIYFLYVTNSRSR